MAAVLPGYEYDIFISYRQKDNHSDQWVSNFVKYLKEEIDATFKVNISIKWLEFFKKLLQQLHLQWLLSHHFSYIGFLV